MIDEVVWIDGEEYKIVEVSEENCGDTVKVIGVRTIRTIDVLSHDEEDYCELNHFCRSNNIEIHPDIFAHKYIIYPKTDFEYDYCIGYLICMSHWGRGKGRFGYMECVDEIRKEIILPRNIFPKQKASETLEKMEKTLNKIATNRGF
jgi:Pyruvate/2-oxoacid:ferredoxin oxidoreductase delta subunit